MLILRRQISSLLVIECCRLTQRWSQRRLRRLVFASVAGWRKIFVAVAQLLVVRPLHTTMKKKSKSKLFWLGIMMALCCAAIAPLELFDLHPQFHIGRFHSIWVGFRHMDFASETTTVPTPGGEKVIGRGEGFGPIKIYVEV